MNKIACNLALALTTCAVCAISSPSFTATLSAVDDSYTTPENTELIVGAPGVLSNDIWNAADGVPTVDLVSNPTYGSLSLGGDGSFTYIPAQNFTGTDTFTYEDVYSFEECLGSACFFIISQTSNLATVTIDATPLPAALPLFATGIGGLGLLGWRRKRKAQVVA